jgi:phage terminase large subunit
MGTLRFCREKLKPMLANRFPGMPVLVIGDPAGQQRAQTDERSVFDILKSEGFRVVAAKTNSVVARLSAVDKLLTRVVDGKPAMLIDPECRDLINALRGGYRYKVKSSGDVEDKPEKNKYSHIADAFQYACLHADNNLTGDVLTPKAREVQKVAFEWT